MTVFLVAGQAQKIEVFQLVEALPIPEIGVEAATAVDEPPSTLAPVRSSKLVTATDAIPLRCDHGAMTSALLCSVCLLAASVSVSETKPYTPVRSISWQTVQHTQIVQLYHPVGSEGTRQQSYSYPVVA